MLIRSLRLAMLWCLCLALVATLPALAQPATDLPAARLMSPAELVKILQSRQSKLLIFNVGPRLMYLQGHIPGAEYTGPASEPEARKQLHERVQKLPRNSFIVLYCGCCPWIYCPNVNPAYRELADMGFTNVKVLKIDNNFGADWVEKHYPTAR